MLRQPHTADEYLTIIAWHTGSSMVTGSARLADFAQAEVNMATSGNTPSHSTAKRAWQWAKNLKELWLLGTFWLATVEAPFDRPMLEVTYRLDSLYPPIAAEGHVNKAIEDTNQPSDCVGALSGLVKSPDLLYLRIRNNSSATIEEVDIQIDAFTVADVALHSNSSRIMADRQELTSLKIADDCIATFPKFTSIPPKAQVSMILWGDFHTFRLRELVRVSSTAKTTTVARQGTASGLGLFLATHLAWIGVFVAVALLLIGLRRFR
jgi:hypothetical protein